jgi:hypothetical protein
MGKAALTHHDNKARTVLVVSSSRVKRHSGLNGHAKLVST